MAHAKDTYCPEERMLDPTVMRSSIATPTVISGVVPDTTPEINHQRASKRECHNFANASPINEDEDASIAELSVAHSTASQLRANSMQQQLQQKHLVQNHYQKLNQLEQEMVTRQEMQKQQALLKHQAQMEQQALMHQQQN